MLYCPISFRFFTTKQCPFFFHGTEYVPDQKYVGANRRRNDNKSDYHI